VSYAAILWRAVPYISAAPSSAIMIAGALVLVEVTASITEASMIPSPSISPALRTRMYSIRFFVGFLGAAAAAPLVAWLHERTGNLAAATPMMAGFGVVTLFCALAFPDREEELRPELWGAAPVAAE